MGLGAAALVGTAGYASAQDSGPPAGTGAGREFVCAHLSDVQKLQADHLTLVGDRLALLNEAKTAAEQSGNTKAVERITTPDRAGDRPPDQDHRPPAEAGPDVCRRLTALA